MTIFRFDVESKRNFRLKIENFYLLRQKNIYGNAVLEIQVLK
jgi:hypothetical protein